MNRNRALTIACILGCGLTLHSEMVGAQASEFTWVNALPEDAHPRLTHGTFESTSMGVEVGYVIYLPPGYGEPSNAGRRYPVVYYLHGGLSGTEITSIGAMDFWHDAIETGVVPPRIYVFVNGGPHSHYNYKEFLAETAFVKELVPHIDRNYRTVSTRSGRAIQGFSAGGRGTARIMLKYPELFCSATPMGGGHQQERLVFEGRSEESNSGISLDAGYSSWGLAGPYAASPNAVGLSILVVVGTEDFNYEANLEWMAYLESLDIRLERKIIPGVGHNLRGVLSAVGHEIMLFQERCFSSVGDR